MRRSQPRACNLIQSKTAKFAAGKGAIACPTLVTYEYLGVEGPSLGLDPISVSKVDTVKVAGMNRSRSCTRRG